MFSVTVLAENSLMAAAGNIPGATLRVFTMGCPLGVWRSYGREGVPSLIIGVGNGVRSSKTVRVWKLLFRSVQFISSRCFVFLQWNLNWVSNRQSCFSEFYFHSRPYKSNFAGRFRKIADLFCRVYYLVFDILKIFIIVLSP